MVEGIGAHIEDIKAKYGGDSNAYRVRVLGEFPTSDDETVIPLALVLGAVGRNVSTLDYCPVWGVDVARFGDDRTALAKRQKNTLLEPVKSWNSTDLMATVGKIKAEYDATPYDLRPREILIDIIGLGAGVYDRCKEIGLPVRGINVGEAASSRENCARLRDELWFKDREWFQDKACSMPQDDGLIAELTAPTYAFTSTGKMLVESKADMKKRGMRSPDLADAFLLTFDLLQGRRLRRYSERARYAFLGVPFDEGNIGKPGSEEFPGIPSRLAGVFYLLVRVQHRSVRNRRRLRRRFHAQGQP